MKILELRHAGSSGGALPTLILTTDSSTVRDGRPVFLPDISKLWRCDFAIAYQMCRLGKSIGEKFAARYYDMMTLTARMVPLDMVGEDDCQWSPWATAFDGALALGRWIEVAPVTSVGIVRPQSVSLGAVRTGINRAVKMLSSEMIIKTGDIIIPSTPLHSMEIKIGDSVEASVNGECLLKFNVK